MASAQSSSLSRRSTLLSQAGTASSLSVESNHALFPQASLESTDSRIYLTSSEVSLFTTRFSLFLFISSVPFGSAGAEHRRTLSEKKILSSQFRTQWDRTEKWRFGRPRQRVNTFSFKRNKGRYSIKKEERQFVSAPNVHSLKLRWLSLKPLIFLSITIVER